MAAAQVPIGAPLEEVGGDGAYVSVEQAASPSSLLSYRPPVRTLLPPPLPFTKAKDAAVSLLSLVCTAIHLEEDEEIGSTSHAALGEIEVDVSRIRAEYRSVPHNGTKFRPVGPVNERSKKAGVHCVACVFTILLPLSLLSTRPSH